MDAAKGIVGVGGGEWRRCSERARLSTHHRGAELEVLSLVVEPNSCSAWSQTRPSNINKADYRSSKRVTEVQLELIFRSLTISSPRPRPNIIASWLPT